MRMCHQAGCSQAAERLLRWLACAVVRLEQVQILQRLQGHLSKCVCYQTGYSQAALGDRCDWVAGGCAGPAEAARFLADILQARMPAGGRLAFGRAAAARPGGGKRAGGSAGRGHAGAAGGAAAAGGGAGGGARIVCGSGGAPGSARRRALPGRAARPLPAGPPGALLGAPRLCCVAATTSYAIALVRVARLCCGLPCRCHHILFPVAPCCASNFHTSKTYPLLVPAADASRHGGRWGQSAYLTLQGIGACACAP